MNGWLRPLRRARLRVFCWITCALLPLLAPSPANAATDAQSCVSQLVFDPTSGGFLPVNNFGTEQDFLNCFGWQLFIAMNWPVNPGWPANASLAGEPDTQSSVAQFGVPATPGQPMRNAPVWASYKDASRFLLPRLFHEVAASRSAELFVLLALVIVLLTASVTTLVPRWALLSVCREVL